MEIVEEENLRIKFFTKNGNENCFENIENNSSPGSVLLSKACEAKVGLYDEEFAKKMDEMDPMALFREKFYYPKMKDLPCVDEFLVEKGMECVYLNGNSLGLKPKSADEYMRKSLIDWEKRASLSHVYGSLPAISCDLPGRKTTAKFVGAKVEEVVLMNGLTVNLHLLLISFYVPNPNRHKILMEGHAFSSDIYAARSQIRYHGYNPNESLIILSPRAQEILLRTEDILKMIDEEGESIAIILFGGIQYYTGQKFDMKRITEAGHRKGCFVGFDLAHAVGNVQLHLHNWEVDFACWCSYKYLNSGAGGIAGAFIHEKHNSRLMPKLHGWWSNINETRFEMKEVEEPAIGISGLRLSNPPPWLMCLNLASLEIFEETSIEDLTQKQFLLTGYLELLLNNLFRELENGKPVATIITPNSPDERGCQLSIMFYNVSSTIVLRELQRRGVLCDHRKPNVIRMAPVPLYNSFRDVFRAVNCLKDVLKGSQKMNA